MIEKKRNLKKPGMFERNPNMTGSHDANMPMLLAELLHGGTKTHMTHLKVTSYAAHIALNEFYDALPGLADAVIEQLQGLKEKLIEFPTVSVAPINTKEEAVSYLRDLYMKVDMASQKCEHSEIIALFDDIKSQINSTKYKLIFLK